jgi:hypothetical protein
MSPGRVRRKVAVHVNIPGSLQRSLRRAAAFETRALVNTYFHKNSVESITSESTPLVKIWENQTRLQIPLTFFQVKDYQISRRWKRQEAGLKVHLTAGLQKNRPPAHHSRRPCFSFPFPLVFKVRRSYQKGRLPPTKVGRFQQSNTGQTAEPGGKVSGLMRLAIKKLAVLAEPEDGSTQNVKESHKKSISPSIMAYNQMLPQRDTSRDDSCLYNSTFLVFT